MLATAILTPLAFWPSQYFATEAVKTIVIAVGTLASAALFLISSLKDKSLSLPPRQMVWTGVLLALATVVSSIQSGHFMKSFFGQGFEVGTGSFLILMLVAGWVAYVSVARRADRLMVIYSAIGASYIVLYILHALRFMFGVKFLSLGILNTLTSTLVGSWYSIGIYSGLVAVLVFVAIRLLPLSPRLKVLYWVLFAASVVGLVVVGGRAIWEALALVFLALAVYFWKTDSLKSAILPIVICIVSAVMVFQGTAISNPVADKVGASYSELSLPWQMTMDVAAGELKANPLFGTGPNRFTQAFLTYKPAIINSTDLWGVEFSSGFGTIPTFVVTEGFVGSILWIIFFVFFAILGVKSLRTSSSSGNVDSTVIGTELPYARFAILSSFIGAAFLWVMSILYVTPHSMFLFAFLMTGLWLGSSVAYGRLRASDLRPQQGSRMYPAVQAISVVSLVVAIIWGLVFVKDTAALAYFDGGLKQLTVTGNSSSAEAYFSKALSLHPTDIFWQGRAEAALGQARSIVNAVASDKNASTTLVIAQASTLVNNALDYAQKAVMADDSNYYNYVSAARVAEAANSLHMDKSYETGVGAYNSAIERNRMNPSLYVSLARFQASNNKLDDAIQTIGSSLQVKNNYLDSVFLLSQIEAVKGNLPDAITAAQFAAKLNPQNPLLFFQLGLFQYTAGSYADAVKSLSEAVKLQPDYANAKYFLGLADARIGQNADAIVQFTDLEKTNPDNNEIKAIIAALQAGKSLFAGAQPAVGNPAPEKRSTPPLPEKATSSKTSTQKAK